jgi:hypothetical protein
VLQLLASVAIVPGMAFMFPGHVFAAVAAFHLLMLSGLAHRHVLGHLVACSRRRGLSSGKRRGH